MADSIVRLKVESSEYDQKLKRAAEGLTEGHARICACPRSDGHRFTYRHR